jgi:hypothetical protein
MMADNTTGRMKARAQMIRDITIKIARADETTLATITVRDGMIDVIGPAETRREATEGLLNALRRMGINTRDSEQILRSHMNNRA